MADGEWGGVQFKVSNASSKLRKQSAGACVVLVISDRLLVVVELPNGDAALEFSEGGWQ